MDLHGTALSLLGEECRGGLFVILARVSAES